MDSWLLTFGFWLLAIGFWLLAFGFWLLAFCCWLFAVGFLLLTVGCWLLAVDFVSVSVSILVFLTTTSVLTSLFKVLSRLMFLTTISTPINKMASNNMLSMNFPKKPIELFFLLFFFGLEPFLGLDVFFPFFAVAIRIILLQV
ncbi:MAG: hypothetical protein E7067_08500 [Lentimicrobiaceae bacterium]|nr:hypothetical protein [Lentimicrobiaceae bacterium]